MGIEETFCMNKAVEQEHEIVKEVKKQDQLRDQTIVNDTANLLKEAASEETPKAQDGTVSDDMPFEVMNDEQTKSAAKEDLLEPAIIKDMLNKSNEDKSSNRREV